MLLHVTKLMHHHDLPVEVDATLDTATAPAGLKGFYSNLSRGHAHNCRVGYQRFPTGMIQVAVG